MIGKKNVKPNEHQRCRERFTNDCNETPLLCREEERKSLETILTSNLCDKKGCCVYISGVPGTGKTATVDYTINTIMAKQSIDTQMLKIVKINCLGLKNIKDIYVTFWKEVVNKQNLRISSFKASSNLEKYFAGTSDKDIMILLVLDEIDTLINKSYSFIYNFFEWSNRPRSNLILLAISNTMDLPERTLPNKIVSRLGLYKINFRPYSYKQLLEIVKSKIGESRIMSDDAIELCVRKVSVLSGDVRKVFNICKKAIDIGNSLTNTKKTLQVVNIEIMDKIMRETFSITPGFILESLSICQKLFLALFFNISRAETSSSVTLDKMFDVYCQICRVHNLEVLNVSNVLKICTNLRSLGFVEVDSKVVDIYCEIRVSLSHHEFKSSIKNDLLLKKILLD